MLTRTHYHTDGEPNPVAGDPANQEPDYAGYSSPEDLVKGYRESGAEARRQKERADRAETLLQTLAQQHVPANSVRPREEEQLETLGIPVDALNFIIDRRAGQIADERVKNSFEPIAKTFQGRSSMMSRYPDYTKYEADVARHIESDPELSSRYQKIFQTDPETALEFAFLKFGETQRQTHPQRGGGNVNKAERAQAQIPGNRTGDTRQSEGDPNWRARAREQYAKNGDSQAFARAVLGKALSDEFLNAGR